MSDSARGASGGLWWSLAGRVWLTNLILVLLMAALGVLAISRLALLESSVNRALSRNYQSIQAAQKMSGVIAAFRSGDLSASQARAEFRQWLAAERGNITEPGEDRVAAEIAADGIWRSFWSKR